MIPLFIDRRMSYLQPCASGESLLTAPVGAGSFLDYLAARVAPVAGGNLLVVPTFEHDGAYVQAVEASTSRTVRVVDPRQLSEPPGEFESSDCLLVVDPVRWPVNGFDLCGTVRGLGDYRGASHVVAVGTDSVGDMRERVQRDETGQVTRVARLYNGVTWPEVAGTEVFLSVIPARAVDGMRFESLGRMRTVMAARGVLSRDIPLASDVFDLTKRSGLLALNEWVLHATGFPTKGNGVRMGRGCQVHPSARLIGPVVLHDGVVVAENATVLGPAVVGAESTIGRGAVVVRSVLTARTVVEAGAEVLHQVAGGRCVSPGNGAGHPVEPAGAILMRPDSQAGTLGLDVPPASVRRKVHVALKRVMDIVASAIALAVLSPLLAVVAILIKRDSPGPVFFTHRREQRGGKEFPCLKFRTMTSDAHQQQRELYLQNAVDGPQFKMGDDPRVTRLGLKLRAWNIDELPQLLNVLAGQMSLVGPRPSPFRENQICVPWRRARLSVQPGITGLWQVCRSPDRSSGGDFHEWIYYDIAYVRHFSIWLDIKILLATVLTLGGRRRVAMNRLIREDSEHAPQAGKPLRISA